VDHPQGRVVVAVRSTVSFHKLERLSNPAAGAEFAFVAPGQGIWRVYSIRFTVATSAIVANRTVAVVIDDGNVEGYRASAPASQAANLTVRYCAAAGVPPGGTAAGGLTIPLPHYGAVLLPGWRLAVDVDAIDAGDQLSAVAALLQEFPTGPGYELVPSVPTDRNDWP